MASSGVEQAGQVFTLNFPPQVADVDINDVTGGLATELVEVIPDLLTGHDFPGPQGKPHLKTALLRPRVAGTSPGRKNHTLSRREKGFEEPSATMEPRPNARPPKPAKPPFKPAPKPTGKHSAAAQAAAAAEAPAKPWGKGPSKGRPARPENRPAKTDSRRAGTHETGRPDPNAAPKAPPARSKPTNRPPTNRTAKRPR